MTRKSSYIGLSLLLVSTLSFAEDTSPAAKKKFAFQDLLNEAGGSSSEAPTVAGVRGLEETGAAVDTKARDYAAIDRLEQVVIHEDELKNFIDEGKLK